MKEKSFVSKLIAFNSDVIKPRNADSISFLFFVQVFFYRASYLSTKTLTKSSKKFSIYYHILLKISNEAAPYTHSINNNKYMYVP